MSDLVIHPAASPAADGTFLDVTPASAGWTLRRLRGAGGSRRGWSPTAIPATARCASWSCAAPPRSTPSTASGATWAGVRTRGAARPDAAYLPPGTTFQIASADAAEVALCWGPAPDGGARARVLPGDAIEVETRGYGSQERTIQPILMADQQADSLLVVEVLTPGGNWSSYPPHKHDHDNPPAETFLEETYYHRITPDQGFGLQRVYSQDRSLDETLSFGDRDCVLVPRGYHTVSAPPGYDLYYLNVMAGPKRQWAVVNDPDHEWRVAPSPAT